MEEIVMGKKEGATTSENIKILTDKDQLGSAGASGTTTSAGSSGTTTSAGASGTTTSAGASGSTTGPAAQSENVLDLSTGDQPPHEKPQKK
jgi:hypothetical protein